MWGRGRRPHPHICRFISFRVGIFSMLLDLWPHQAHRPAIADAAPAEWIHGDQAGLRSFPLPIANDKSSLVRPEDPVDVAGANLAHRLEAAPRLGRTRRIPYSSSMLPRAMA